MDRNFGKYEKKLKHSGFDGIRTHASQVLAGPTELRSKTMGATNICLTFIRRSNKN